LSSNKTKLFLNILDQEDNKKQCDLKQNKKVTTKKITPKFCLVVVNLKAIFLERLGITRSF
jgi:hypothetical protein